MRTRVYVGERGAVWYWNEALHLQRLHEEKWLSYAMRCGKYDGLAVIVAGLPHLLQSSAQRQALRMTGMSVSRKECISWSAGPDMTWILVWDSRHVEGTRGGDEDRIFAQTVTAPYVMLVFAWDSDASYAAAALLVATFILSSHLISGVFTLNELLSQRLWCVTALAQVFECVKCLHYICCSQ